jgi:uncharacterized protein
MLAARCPFPLTALLTPCQPLTPPRSYLPSGFILNNTQVEGAILCLPDLWLLWDARDLSSVNMQSLAVLDLMAPPPEVLVVGCGARMRRLPDAFIEELRRRGIAVEVLDTVRGPAARRGGLRA